MDITKKLGVKKDFAPGELLEARDRMSEAYLKKEKKERPMSKMTPKERAKEKKETSVHEKAEHLTKKQVNMLKKKVVTKLTKPAAKPKLGTGKRFSNLTKKLSAKGAKNPKALAAVIGRKKFGAKKMAKMAAKGRSKK